MKSGKQRKAEIKAARIDRVKKQSGFVKLINGPIPKWAAPVNKNEVVYHSMYFDVPLFYIDKEFKCRDCDTTEVWTAKQQKWWYEIAKGNLETFAVRCKKCRNAIKQTKADQKKHMEEMAKKQPHPNESFFRNTKEN